MKRSLAVEKEHTIAPFRPDATRRSAVKMTIARGASRAPSTHLRGCVTREKSQPGPTKQYRHTPYIYVFRVGYDVLRFYLAPPWRCKRDDVNDGGLRISSVKTPFQGGRLCERSPQHPFPPHASNIYAKQHRRSSVIWTPTVLMCN